MNKCFKTIEPGTKLKKISQKKKTTVNAQLVQNVSNFTDFPVRTLQPTPVTEVAAEIH